jgi:hypothetical protein
MIIKAKKGQDIFDITVQQFGDIENLFDLLNDNPTLNINSILGSGKELKINSEDKGNVTIKNEFLKTSFKVMNADEDTFAENAGDFNNDFNNDFFNN